MAQLIDSSVFIGLERRGLSLEHLLLLTRDDQAAISTISASELLVGLHRSNSLERYERREEFIEGVLNTLPVIPVDLVAARSHARLAADMTKAGNIIAAHDLLIGATALAHGYEVLTDNVRDFERVPGLIVNRPTWPK